MSKKDNLNKLTTFLALALSHKIGSLVNSNEIYSQKYKKESDNYLNLAREITFEENFNSYDKEEIKTTLKRKLTNELTKKDFLDNKKFTLIDEEIDKTIKELQLN